jgi:uncharacterized protein
MLSPELIIERLRMKPHPEGGHYVETWRHRPAAGGRGAGTAIHFLLQRGEVSHWHRVDADEIWLFHAGDPLAVSISEDGLSVDERVLGIDLLAGQQPQVIVPANAWQSALTQGDWTLVSCTVSPAFLFERFELAPPGWKPG